MELTEANLAVDSEGLIFKAAENYKIPLTLSAAEIIGVCIYIYNMTLEKPGPQYSTSKIVLGIDYKLFTQTKCNNESRDLS